MAVCDGKYMVLHIYRAGREQAFLLAYCSTFVSWILVPPAAPSAIGVMSTIKRVESTVQGAPRVSAVRAITSSTAETTSVATPIGTTTAAPVESGDVRSFRRNLGRRFSTRLRSLKFTR